jgi:hypothetical protein
MKEFQHKMKKIHLNTARDAYPTEIKRSMALPDHIMTEQHVDAYPPTRKVKEEKRQ